MRKLRAVVCATLLVMLLGCRQDEAFPTRVETLSGWAVIEPHNGMWEVDGDSVIGAWYWETQNIRVDTTRPVRVQWHTLYHETCHAAMDGAGLTAVRPYDDQEAICDAIASARVRERFGMEVP